jgi:hypothetical protein
VATILHENVLWYYRLMKRVFQLSLIISAIGFWSLLVISSRQAKDAVLVKQEPSAQETSKKGNVGEVEATSAEQKPAPTIEAVPIQNVEDAPTNSPPLPSTSSYDGEINNNGPSAYDEFMEQEADRCRALNEEYTRCIEDFNADMGRYTACEEVNQDFQDKYVQDMDQYNRCMDDYQDDLENYYVCLEHAASSPIGGPCSKPTTMFCHKPMNPYSQYCQKPTNFCRKPTCF